MDIWVARCNKTVKCRYCGEDITPGEAAVFGKLWRRYVSKEEGGKPLTWVKNFRWHAQRKRDGQCCWLVAALEELLKRPHVETRGRKKILLDKDTRRVRNRVLRERARQVQRLKELTLAPGPTEIDAIVRVGRKISDLKEQIEPLGGVPKSWG